MKTALITGGSRGIGKATAEALRAKGWEVITPTRNELSFTIDAQVFEWASKQFNCEWDSVIMCHGEWFSNSLPMPPDWDRKYRMRVTNPMMLLNGMLIGGRVGCVVMVSSTRGFVGGVNTGPYSAACAAQIALMQGYAREYPGVRFNVVAPGWTDTDMGKIVKATGGVSNPNAVPQPASAVAEAIVGLVEGEENGKVLRVVDGQVTEAEWVWK